MRLRHILSIIALLSPVLTAAPLTAQSSGAGTPQARQRAARVTITRDDWGIAHIKAPTDADAVFGMIYAQAEDDFNRIEMNYLTALGRVAEAEGPNAIWQDLRQRLYIDPVELQREYRESPQWLRRLMDAWAEGLNFYLATHPEVHPKVLTRFEPWMALSFSEGSIGGDIERINLGQLKAFYDGTPGAAAELPPLPVGDGAPPEPRGSNGISIAPVLTQSGHAMLLINPHTSFFFRSVVQVTSDEGLNVYGAVTWGQFFVYQGFNPRLGWMHTSSGVDNVDEYRETVVRTANGWGYRFGGRTLPMGTRRISLQVKTDAGMETRTFTTYFTRHGPVIRKSDSSWVSVAMMFRPRQALEQAYGRTKARDLVAFRRTMDLHANSSNNTLYADADGHIGYWHPNFIPRRDPAFDYTKPVDGSDPRTEWRGLLGVDSAPQLLDPATGWLYNSNNWPWSAAGSASQRRADFPAYVETGTTESPRGRHALRELGRRKGYTLDTLLAVAYDSYLPAFDTLLPPLIRAWDALPATDSLKERLREPIALLKGWDYRWDASSEATTLAIFWATEAGRRSAQEARAAGLPTDDFLAARGDPALLLRALAAACDKLTADFGNWRTPWGEVNRFQRLTGDIVQPFADSGASIPVPFPSARWGSLASFGANPYPGTKRWYGTSGNSFVAIVEFGDSVRARAVTAGGESGSPASPHFNDQARAYAAGDLQPVYFYPSQLVGHTERVYHPGVR
jgi:acyl-homoserine-lactone acylase